MQYAYLECVKVAAASKATLCQFWHLVWGQESILLSRVIQFSPKASGFHYAEEHWGWDWVTGSLQEDVSGALDWEPRWALPSCKYGRETMDGLGLSVITVLRMEV